MSKKIFACANTYYLGQFVKPTNIKYTFCGTTLEDATYNLDFDFEFSEEFFQHVRFYEVYFNEKNQPIQISLLGKESDNHNFPNGWNDFTIYMSRINYDKFFLRNNEDEYWFDDNGALFEHLLKWAKETARENIKVCLVDTIEYEE